MQAGLRHRVLTSVSAGALVGVLTATGMAAATAGEVAPSTEEGTSGGGTVEMVSHSTWWGKEHYSAE